MKKLLFSIVAVLSFSCSFAQTSVRVNNNTTCDIEISVYGMIAGGCTNTGVNFLNLVLPPGTWEMYEDAGATSNEFKVDIIVDPSGTPVPLPSVYADGSCGPNTSNDPTACGGSGVTATGSGSTNWIVDVN